MHDEAHTSITIVIPTYNRPGMLRQAVYSALQALPTGGAVLVIDDHSSPSAHRSLADITHPALRIEVNRGSRGPAGARNFGVELSTSALVLFLDDDDLMIPGYPLHVLQLRRTNQELTYGFSKTIHFETAPTALPPYAARGGYLITGLRFRKQIAGLGCGFWIDREAFLRIGGICEDIKVNEDTDLSCRLLAADLQGWVSTAPGVWVRSYRPVTDGTDMDHVTLRTAPAIRAGYFQTIMSRNAEWLAKRPDAQRHILKRLVKMHAKAGATVAGLTACRNAPTQAMKLELFIYFALNTLIYRLRRG